jgi:uncharacterized protein RhaS with RHS repeats
MMFSTIFILRGSLLPLGFDAGDANLYRYVINNPTNATDPTGLDEWVRYLPFVEQNLQPGGSAVAEFRDKYKNKFVVYSSGNELTGTVKGPHTKAETVGECKISGGVNRWVFYTKNKGRFNIITWYNYAPNGEGNDGRFDPLLFNRNRATLEKKVEAAMKEHSDSPSKAEKALRALLLDPSCNRKESKYWDYKVKFVPTQTEGK